MTQKFTNEEYLIHDTPFYHHIIYDHVQIIEQIQL